MTTGWPLGGVFFSWRESEGSSEAPGSGCTAFLPTCSRLWTQGLLVLGDSVSLLLCEDAAASFPQLWYYTTGTGWKPGHPAVLCGVGSAFCISKHRCPQNKASVNIQACDQSLSTCIAWEVKSESHYFLPAGPPHTQPEESCPESSPQQGCSVPGTPGMLQPARMQNACQTWLPGEEAAVLLCIMGGSWSWAGDADWEQSRDLIS